MQTGKEPVKVSLRLAFARPRLNPRPFADHLSAIKRRHTIEARNQKLRLTLHAFMEGKKLLPAGMRFSLTRKHRIRPLIFLLRQRNCNRGGLRLDSPIRRRRPNAPDVPWLLQRDSHEPVLPIGPQRNTICHRSGRAHSAGKLIQQNRQSRLEGLRNAHAASLRVHHQRMTVLAERNRRIEAGQSKRYLRANSRAAPRRFVGFCSRTHIQTLFRLYVRSQSSSVLGRTRPKPK
jgi:hypothetical protein